MQFLFKKATALPPEYGRFAFFTHLCMVFQIDGYLLQKSTGNQSWKLLCVWLNSCVIKYYFFRALHAAWFAPHPSRSRRRRDDAGRGVRPASGASVLALGCCTGGSRRPRGGPPGPPRLRVRFPPETGPRVGSAPSLKETSPQAFLDRGRPG